MQNREAILKFWNQVVKVHSPEIDEWIKQENLYLRKIIKKNSIILDVGFGNGDTIMKIKNVAKKIVGIDNNTEKFDNIKKRLLEFGNIELFCEDAKDMHFEDNAFDYVICMGNTFGNLGKAQEEAINEMKRVVKINGKIVISVYSENALPKRLEIYKRAGLTYEIISEDGTVLLGEETISEQFSRKKLTSVFNRAKLKSKIIELTPITYICELRKT